MKERLEEILHQSSALMAKHGYYGTSMRDLAREMNFSLSGLYNYFKNKEELLYLINYHGFTSIINNLKVMLTNVKTPEERLYILIYNHIQYFISHRDEMKVMMLGTHEMSQERSDTIKSLKNGYNLIGQNVVSQLCKTQMPTPMDDKELDRKTFLLFGMLNWIFGWYSSRTHGHAEDLVSDIYSTFTSGIFQKSKLPLDSSNVNRLYNEQKSEVIWSKS